MNLSQHLFKLASGGPVPQTEAETAFSEAPASAAPTPAAAGDASRVLQRAGAADELLARRPQAANLRMMDGAPGGIAAGIGTWAKAHPMLTGLGLVGVGGLVGHGISRAKKRDDED